MSSTLTDKIVNEGGKYIAQAHGSRIAAERGSSSRQESNGSAAPHVARYSFIDNVTVVGFLMPHRPCFQPPDKPCCKIPDRRIAFVKKYSSTCS